MTVASRPTGASTSTSSRRWDIAGIRADEQRPTMSQGLALDVDPSLRERELVDRRGVRTVLLLHDDDRAPQLAGWLEEAQRDDRVGEVAHVDGLLLADAHEVLLRTTQHEQHVGAREIGHELV